jgi:3-dehydroquinate synthase
MRKVQMELVHTRYDIFIEPGILSSLGKIVHKVAPHEQCALLADESVYRIYGQRAKQALREAGYNVVVGLQPVGENNKTLDTVGDLYKVLLDAKLERRSPVISLGGGVNGDTSGFVAATYLRGVPFIQCPTTLLAMVDASVGGKVGVNVVQGKNLIGSFYQPRAVVIDPQVLASLPAREFRCGLAECVKHAMISDAGLFDWMEGNRNRILQLDGEVLEELIERNVAIKAGIVGQDEKEHGVRALLNFGHTFGHAIETTAGYGVVEHGEAVALGMIAVTRLAVCEKLCSEETFVRLAALIEKLGLPTRVALAPVPELLRAMTMDKKIIDGRIRLVLPQKVGAATITDSVAEEHITEAWKSIEK